MIALTLYGFQSKRCFLNRTCCFFPRVIGVHGRLSSQSLGSKKHKRPQKHLHRELPQLSIPGQLDFSRFNVERKEFKKENQLKRETPKSEKWEKLKGKECLNLSLESSRSRLLIFLRWGHSQKHPLFRRFNEFLDISQASLKFNEQKSTTSRALAVRRLFSLSKSGRHPSFGSPTKQLSNLSPETQSHQGRNAGKLACFVSHFVAFKSSYQRVNGASWGSQNKVEACFQCKALSSASSVSFCERLKPILQTL